MDTAAAVETAQAVAAEEVVAARVAVKRIGTLTPHRMYRGRGFRDL